MFHGVRILVLGGLLVVAGACRKELVAPGECPASCPGGSPEVVDTVLTPVAGMDSTYSGYTPAGANAALLVSSGVPAIESRTVLRFLPQPDSLLVDGENHTYTIDSVALRLGVLSRDTTIHGLQVHLYRVPVAVADTGVTFGDVDPFLTAANLVGTIAVDDSVASGPLRLLLTGAELTPVDIPPADSGVLALAVAISANAPAGVRVGSQSAGGLAPLFQVFARVDGVDEDNQEQTIGRVAGFSTYVLETPWVADPQLLAVGGEPSSRSLLRFDLPSSLRSTDSSQIIRATLELVPAAPVAGVAFDTARVRARGVVTDLGAKSPLCSVVPGNLCGSAVVSRVYSASLVAGSGAVLSIELADLIRAMQGERASAEAIFLEVDPEAGTFARVQFGSTRTAAIQPRLRITFVRAFPFEAR